MSNEELTRIAREREDFFRAAAETGYTSTAKDAFRQVAQAVLMDVGNFKARAENAERELAEAQRELQIHKFAHANVQIHWAEQEDRLRAQLAEAREESRDWQRDMERIIELTGADGPASIAALAVSGVEELKAQLAEAREDTARLGLVIGALRRRIHYVEGHNQYFFRCESGWCNPDEKCDPAREQVALDAVRRKETPDANL